uniref:Enkurin domain containing 1 n=1 Tax=Cynoglossus semilaevis TaxID=244447 RepID=A0A3P8WU04_CYNSE
MCEGPSSISGPIPPDPSLIPQDYRRPVSGLVFARTPAPPPRIGPNATHILERGQRGVVGQLLKLDGVSFAPIPKPKPKVYDFSKENVRRLREIQRRYKEQEAHRAQSRPVPVKALWTSPKYEKVPSRVTAHLQMSSPTVKPQCKGFLKAHSNSGSTSTPRPRSASCVPLEIEGHTIDFIRHNARAAGKAGLRRSQSLTNLRDKPVPSAYDRHQMLQHLLEERKEQWRREAEERRKNAPDPTIPSGHTMMSESERQETLKSLKETHRSLVTELLSIPLKADNLSVRSRRAHLDCRLSEIEEAIKIFSRDKVYVKIDS